jgi:SAM-dependent methyltransferase
MKIAAKPQNLMEWIGMKANLIPRPLAGFVWALTARALFLAFKLDIFEAAKDSPQTLGEIADRTKLHPRGLAPLMNLLTSIDFFRYKDGKFGLADFAAKWCLKESPDSLYHNMRFLDETIWNEMNYWEEFLKTGKGLEVHDNYYTEEQWDWYQLGQYDEAKIMARSVPKVTPMPSNPTEMLDIGGSHGLYSVELCKKYPTLKATILDLPQAVEKARPILEKRNMEDRVSYWIGDALTDDFGEDRYDFILMASLAHHFSSEQNIAVSRKAAKALKTGGYFAIQDWLRPEPSSTLDAIAVTLDMYFNVTSTTGTWTLDEVKGFQEKAGLTHYKVNRFMGMPSLVQVCAKKE